MSREQVEVQIRAISEDAKRHSKGLVALLNSTVSETGDIRVGYYPTQSNLRWVDVPKASIESIESIGWTVVGSQTIPIVVITFTTEFAAIRNLVRQSLIRDELLIAKAQIFNDRPHLIQVVECRLAPEHLNFVWLDVGRIEANGSLPVSQEWNYYRDQNVRFLVRIIDSGTNNRLRAEVECELGTGFNNQFPIHIRIHTENLVVEHIQGSDEADWQQD
jgi:hypothetical protein